MFDYRTIFRLSPLTDIVKRVTFCANNE